METKEFFRRFHWGTVVPAVLTFAAGIAVAAAPAGSNLARSVTVGIFFALSGILCALDFFLDREENPVRLLSGTAQAAAALWMFVMISAPLYIFCIAMAVIIALRAGSDIFGAIKNDGGPRRIVRIVLSALFIAACIVIPCKPFEIGGLLIYTGVLMAAEAVYSFVVACLEGLFEEEETLHFRTVKK